MKKTLAKKFLATFLIVAIATLISVTVIPSSSTLSAAGVTIKADKDPTISYVPTQIINGDFTEMPWMDFEYGGKKVTLSTTYDQVVGYGWNNYSNLTTTARYYNGVGQGWNTSETVAYQTSLFEYIVKDSDAYDNSFHTFNISKYVTASSILNSITNNPLNGAVEMNSSSSATLYQDLVTHGKDIIKWELKHAVRDDGEDSLNGGKERGRKNKDQSVSVSIGSPISDGSGGYLPAVGKSNVQISADTLVEYDYTGIVSQGSKVLGAQAGTDISGLLLHPTTNNDKWYTVTGAYAVPEGQTVTRFAFNSAVDTTNESYGNLLDNIQFYTLVGNLSAVIDENNLTIKGYWGDQTTGRSLVVDFGDNKTVSINMDSLTTKGNFVATISRDELPTIKNNEVYIYHSNYEDVKTEVTVIHDHTWTSSATGSTLKVYCNNDDYPDNCDYYTINNAMTLTLIAQNKTYNGKQYSGATVIKPTNWEKLNIDSLAIYYEGTGTTSYTRSKTAPTNAGTYNALASIDGTNFATAAFTISKANIEAEIKSVDTKKYDGTTAGSGKLGVTAATQVNGEEPVITGTFTWSNAHAGTSTLTVTDLKLGADDAVNYNLLTTSLSYTAKTDDEKIQKSDLDPTTIKWDYSTPYTYNGTDKEVKLDSSTLVCGLTVKSYSDNKKTNVGKYQATAVLDYDPNDFVNTLNVTPLDWEISKADYNTTNWKWSTTTSFTYDGNQKSVTVSGLPEGVSVKEYKDNTKTNAGDYTAKVTFNYDSTNYNEPSIDDCSWSISKADYNMSGASWSTTKSFEYDDEEHSVIVSGLPEGVTVKSYEDNTKTNAGDYTAKVTFNYDSTNYNEPSMDDCSWSITKSSFNPKDPVNGIKWNSHDNFIYSGSNYKVTVNGSTLPAGVTVKSYTNNKKYEAGNYTATVTFDYNPDNFENTIEIDPLDWEIKQASIDVSEIEWDYTSLTYNGSAQSVTVKAKTVPSLITVTGYTDNTKTNAGDYTAYLTYTYDTKNYLNPGDIKLEWSIGKTNYDTTNWKWSETTSFEFDNTEKSVSISGLPEGVTPSYTDNAKTHAGEYSASATFSYDETNYNEPSINPCSWEITKSKYDPSDDEDGIKWNSYSGLIYKGSDYEVTIDESTLPSGVTVKSYTDNKKTNAGDYTALVEFEYNEDDFENEIKIDGLNWSIGKATIDVSVIEWNYTSVLEYSGSPQSVTVKDSTVPETITVTGYTGNTETNSGEYTAYLTYTYDTSNYENPGDVTLSWAIGKKNYDTTNWKWSETTSFEFDNTEKSVTISGLPEGVTPSYSNNAKTHAGTYQATATFSYDETNYNEPSINPCDWEITKSKFDPSDDEDGIKWNSYSGLIYKGSDYEVTIDESTLPSGVTVKSYTDNKKTNAGDYTALVEFEYNEDDFENAIEIDGLNWTIEKATIDVSVITWNYDSLTYTGSEQTVEVNASTVPATISVTGYSGNSATNAGDYTAYLTYTYDTVNYENPGDVKLEWSIGKADYDTTNWKWSETTSFEFDNTEKSVTISGLPEGVTPSYTDNAKTHAGEYSASATFSFDETNYNEPSISPCSWEITKSKFDPSDDEDGIKWNSYSGLIYKGSDYEVTIDESTLPSGVTVKSYTDNKKTNAGTYTAEVEFDYNADDFENAIEIDGLSWTIEKATIDVSVITWNYTSLTFTGSEQTVEVNASTVPATISVTGYSGNSATNAGDYTAYLTYTYDTVNYEDPGDVKLEWSIGKANYDTTNWKWSETTSFEFDNTEKSVTISGLPEGVSVKTYENNAKTNAGEYSASVTFNFDETNYNEPSVDPCSWEITKSKFDPKDDEDGIKWNTYSGLVYNKSPYTVTIDETTLPSGVTVKSYANNEFTNAGTYQATVVFDYDPNNFENTIEIDPLDWEISKADYDLSGITWDYVSQFTYNHDDYTVSVNASSLPDTLSVKEYQNNSKMNAGDYTAIASFNYDETNYNEPSTVSVDWSIKKATVTPIVKSIDEKIYDGTTAGGGELTIDPLLNGEEVEFTATFTWSSPNAGTNVLDITNIELVEEFKANYELTTNEILGYTVKSGEEIKKYTPTEDDFKWDFPTEGYTYDGIEKSVCIKADTIPTGYTVTYFNDKHTVTGSYETMAFVDFDETNYNAPNLGTCSWKITKASIDMSSAKWDYVADSFTYDGTSHKVLVTNLPEGVTVKQYSNNEFVNAGDYTAVVIFSYDRDNYGELDFDIECPWSIKKATNVVTVDETPIVVTFGEKVTLPQATSLYAFDIKCNYTEDELVNAGTYNVTFYTEGNENYSRAEATVVVTINKAQANITVDNTPIVVTYGELVNLPSATSNIGTVKVSHHKYDLINAGTYTVSYEVEETENILGAKVELSVTVNKATYDMSKVQWTNGSFTFDNTEKQVTLVNLPDGVKATYSNNVYTNAGDYTASVVFTFDEDNYNAPSVNDYDWVIEKATYDMSGITFESYSVLYDEQAHTIVINGSLPTGCDQSVVTVSYNLGEQTEIGVYNYIASFSFDSANYNAIPDMTATLDIMRKTADIKGYYDKEGEFVEDPTFVIIESNTGIPGDIEIVIELKAEASGKETASGTQLQLDGYLGFGEEFGDIYKISIKRNGVEIQPEDIAPGTVLTIKMRLPENLEGKEFRILHIHDNEDISTINKDVCLNIGAYIIDEEGYIVTMVNKLSEFLFVQDVECNTHYILLALLIGYVIFVGIFLLISSKLNKKDIVIPTIISLLFAVLTIVFALKGTCYYCIVLTIANGFALVIGIMLFAYLVNKDKIMPVQIMNAQAFERPVESEPAPDEEPVQEEVVEEPAPVVVPEPEEEEEEDIGIKLKESIAQAKALGKLDYLSISKAKVIEYLQANYKDYVICNSRANYIETGLPLADTHYYVGEFKDVCFTYVYELDNGNVFFLIKTDKDTAKAIKAKHGQLVQSAFPKSPKKDWYTMLLDDTFKSNDDVWEVLDMILKAPKDDSLSLKESIAQAKSLKVKEELHINKEVVSNYLTEKYGEGVEINKRINYTSTGLPLADTHYDVREEKHNCFVYTYELDNGTSFFLIRTNKKTARSLMKKHESIIPSAFPRSKKNEWYTVVLDKSFESNDDVFDMLDKVYEAASYIVKADEINEEELAKLEAEKQRKAEEKAALDAQKQKEKEEKAALKAKEKEEREAQKAREKAEKEAKKAAEAEAKRLAKEAEEQRKAAEEAARIAAEEEAKRIEAEKEAARIVAEEEARKAAEEEAARKAAEEEAARKAAEEEAARKAAEEEAARKAAEEEAARKAAEEEAARKAAEEEAARKAAEEEAARKAAEEEAKKAEAERKAAERKEKARLRREREASEKIEIKKAQASHEIIKQEVNVAEVQQLFKDEDIVKIVEEDSKTVTRYGEAGREEIVNIDTLSAKFEDGSVIDLEVLKSYGVVSKNCKRVKVLARGTLTKCFTIYCNDYSVDAAKMVVSRGGKIVILRRKEN